MSKDFKLEDLCTSGSRPLMICKSVTREVSPDNNSSQFSISPIEGFRKAGHQEIRSFR